MRQTVVEKLPRPELFNRVMRWTFQNKGVVMHGPTRKGKSRCAWKLAEREYLNGREVKVLDSTFGITFAQKYSVSGSAAYEWLEEKNGADLLLLDDVFKIKLTDAAEGALFMIVDYRTQHGKPMIVTMNDTGASLEERMTTDRGPALVARIREFCENINF